MNQVDASVCFPPLHEDDAPALFDDVPPTFTVPFPRSPYATSFLVLLSRPLDSYFSCRSLLSSSFSPTPPHRLLLVFAIPHALCTENAADSTTKLSVDSQRNGLPWTDGFEGANAQAREGVAILGEVHHPAGGTADDRTPSHVSETL